MTHPLASLRRASTLSDLRTVLDEPHAVAGQTISLRKGSLEHEYFLARSELAAGKELAHGVSHLAELIAADPTNSEFLGLVDLYDTASDGGLETLLPAGDNRYYATEALRALWWAKHRRLDEAIDRLCAVTSAAPSARYLDGWALDWLETGGGLAPLGHERALRLVATVVNAIPEHEHLTHPRRSAATRWTRLALTYFLREPPPDPAMQANADLFLTGLCRKAGRFDEGIRLAENTVRARPSWQSYNALGLLLRRSGRLTDAFQAFRSAYELDGSTPAPFLETGDMFLDAGDWTAALQSYDFVLQHDPGHEWALPSALFCRWREQSSAPFPDDRFPAELRTLAEQGNTRAQQMFAPFRSWDGRVPQPTDATVNVVATLLEQYPPREVKSGTDIKLTLSDVEAPSGQSLIRLIYGNHLTVTTTYSNIADPDPRMPGAHVSFKIWQLDDDRLVPGLPSPPPQIAALVSDLASEPFRGERLWASTSAAAASLTVGDISALLACVCRPPSVPAGHDPFEWIPRVQLTVAFILAHLAPDEPWHTSHRRSALFSLLHGPLDWSIEAAIVALERCVRREPIAALDVSRAFAVRLEARPDSGSVPWELTLVEQWQSMPGIYEEERTWLQNRAQQIRANA